MPWTNHIRNSRAGLGQGRKGAALIIVLALLVLCSVILLAFLSRAQLVRLAAVSSEASIEADLLARAAYDEILLSLRNEIIAGSSDQKVSNVTIYFPATSESAAPSRARATSILVEDESFRNLLKQSVFEIPSYTSTNLGQSYPKHGSYPQASPASSLSTRTPGRDGRFLSTKRWNTPRLFGESGLTNDAQLPYWIYVTRSGPLNGATDTHASLMACRDATNFSYGIGRYAYQVYDISGLLDVNLAGHPATLTPSQISELKGTLSGVVLANIPGMLSSSDFVAWRSGEKSADEFFTNKITATNGFLQPSSGERYFFNRQDLLKYVSSTGAFSTNALPYLTVFNRKKNAPAFSYPDSGPVTTNATNSSPLRIRMATAGTSAISDATWRAGDPVVPRRFALSRLGWLGYDGPRGGVSAANIQAAFGLLWDDTLPDDSNPASLRGDRWVYIGSSGSAGVTSPATEIKTLAQVAQEGREPNFFELLKAAIHRGSLGMAVAGTMAPNADLLYGLEDLQILRIGACMIDQFDSDSYPTLINFSIADGGINPTVEVHGVENLPYVSRIAPFYINPDWPNDPGRTVRRMRGFLTPELWNPHQANETTGPKPAELRLFYTGAFTLRTDTSQLDRTTQFSLTTGSAILSDANFDLFYQPRPLTESITSRTGTFDTGMPFKDFPIGLGDHIVGSELSLSGNMIVPDTIPKNMENKDFWNGYNLTTNEYSKYWTREWYGGRMGESPFNAILQFKNFRGKFQNYNILSSGFYTSDSDLNKLLLGIHNAKPSGEASAGNGFRKEDFPLPYLEDGPKDAWKTVTAPPLSNNPPAPGLPLLSPDRWEDLLTIHRQGGFQIYKPDPRTARLGVPRYNFGDRKNTGAFTWATQHSFAASLRPVDTSAMRKGPESAYPAVEDYAVNAQLTVSAKKYFPAMYERNVQSDGDGSYYRDNDGTTRPGDNYLQTWANSVYNQSQARPVILDRPFRSVGELGYVFRDLPHKSLDLSSDVSVDAALLDYFCVNEAQNSVAGVINANVAAEPVLQALLQGTGKDLHANAVISKAEAQTLSANLASRRVNTPANQSAALVSLTTTNTVSSATTGAYPGIKSLREAAIRSLASIHNERTWNLFVDVIAQTGKFPPGSGKLADFVVEGERRYWVHVAIDRYTGEVVGELREPVLE